MALGIYDGAAYAEDVRVDAALRAQLDAESNRVRARLAFADAAEKFLRKMDAENPHHVERWPHALEDARTLLATLGTPEQEGR
jgi:hypothetical protein